MPNRKVSEITYKRSILKRMSNRTNGTDAGIDASLVLLEGVTFVMSSNCIMKYFKGCEEFFVQKTINCLQEKNAVPKFLQLEMNIPYKFEEKILGRIIQEFNGAVAKRNMKICQCRVYETNVNEPFIHVTVLGNATEAWESKIPKPGLDVVMAGSAGLGGTYVLSSLYLNQLKERFSGSFANECLIPKDLLSIEQSVKIAISNDAVYMHNVSDGGAFGAIWELASSTGLGITVNTRQIPIWQQIVEVSEIFDINPYMLEGTGAILIVCSNGKQMEEALQNEGILAAHIGQLESGNDRITIDGEEKRYLEPPRGDELYKIIEKGD